MNPGLPLGGSCQPSPRPGAVHLLTSPAKLPHPGVTQNLFWRWAGPTLHPAIPPGELFHVPVSLQYLLDVQPRARCTPGGSVPPPLSGQVVTELWQGRLQSCQTPMVWGGHPAPHPLGGFSSGWVGLCLAFPLGGRWGGFPGAAWAGLALTITLIFLGIALPRWGWGRAGR